MAAHSSRKKTGPANLGSLASPLDGALHRRLENGLQVLTREDHSVPIVSVMLWYRVGARVETPGTTGISHFLEHMLFKGSQRYGKGEIDAITARQGGSNNAFTSHDYTAYYFSFASDRWEVALEIESDRMLHTLFDPEEVELERQVILEELSMEQDNPWGALRLEVDRRSFPAHPYGNPILGLAPDVRSITRSQLVDHYHRHYAPDNAVLVVAGDFTTGHAMARIGERFGPLRPAAVPSPEIVPQRPPDGPIRFELPRTGPVARILIGLPAPSVGEPEFYAFHLLDQALSQGRLSRLHRRLVEQERTAVWVETEFSQTLDPYLFFVSAELHDRASVEETEEQIFAELELLVREPLPEGELRRAKNLCLAEFYAGCETTLDQATQLGLAESLGMTRHWSDFAFRIESLTAGEIQRVAADYLLRERATVGVLPGETS